MKKLTLVFVAIIFFYACGKDDTTPPDITLVGGNMTLSLGETYTEPGATAQDDKDGVISDIVSTNDINKAKVGVYTVTYMAKDKAGNEGTNTRKVYYTASLLAGYYKSPWEYSASDYIEVSFSSSNYNKLVFRRFDFYNTAFASYVNILIDKNNFSFFSGGKYLCSNGTKKDTVILTPQRIEYGEKAAGEWGITRMTYKRTIKSSDGAEVTTNESVFFNQ